jgi:hypothetical protein
MAQRRGDRSKDAAGGELGVRTFGDGEKRRQRYDQKQAPAHDGLRDDGSS